MRSRTASFLTYSSPERAGTAALCPVGPRLLCPPTGLRTVPPDPVFASSGRFSGRCAVTAGRSSFGSLTEPSVFTCHLSKASFLLARKVLPKVTAVEKNHSLLMLRSGLVLGRSIRRGPLPEVRVAADRGAAHTPHAPVASAGRFLSSPGGRCRSRTPRPVGRDRGAALRLPFRAHLGL